MKLGLGDIVSHIVTQTHTDKGYEMYLEGTVIGKKGNHFFVEWKNGYQSYHSIEYLKLKHRNAINYNHPNTNLFK